MSTNGNAKCVNSSELETVKDDQEDVPDEGDLNDDIEATFSVHYQMVENIRLSDSSAFILHLSGTNGANTNIAAALSDHSCTIYDLSTSKSVSTWRPHRSVISNIKFSPQNDQLFYSASKDGRVKLWDLRMNKKCAKEFKDDTDGDNKLKPLTSFDVSCGDQHLCAGTELIGCDSFLLFWDVRSTKILGGYWESHTDDVTQVAFHPTRECKVSTGSMDGLINVFDIKEKSEDDALMQSFNTESSVDKLGWFTHDSDDNAMSCITHTENLQLWDSDGAAPYLLIDREHLTRSLHRRPCDNSYLVDVHPMDNPEELLVVGGSTAGCGECLRTFKVCKTSVTPMSLLNGNKQIVRASWYDKHSLVLVTGGEEGIINVWNPKKQSSA